MSSFSKSMSNTPAILKQNIYHQSRVWKLKMQHTSGILTLDRNSGSIRCFFCHHQRVKLYTAWTLKQSPSLVCKAKKKKTHGVSKEKVESSFTQTMLRACQCSASSFPWEHEQGRSWYGHRVVLSCVRVLVVVCIIIHCKPILMEVK